MKDKFKFKVSVTSFRSQLRYHKQANYSNGNIIELSKYEGLKFLKNNKVERINDEDYSEFDNNTITYENLIEILKDRPNENYFFNSDTNRVELIGLVIEEGIVGREQARIPSEEYLIEKISIGEVLFDSCEFKSNFLNIENSQIDSIEITECNLAFIGFYNCSKINEIKIHCNKEIIQSLDIQSCSIIKKSKIYLNNIEKMSIYSNNIKEVKITENNLGINNSEMKIIYNENIERIDITNNKYENLIISNNLLIYKLEIIENRIEKNLKILKNEFSNRIKISKEDKELKEKRKIGEKLLKDLKKKLEIDDDDKIKFNFVHNLEFEDNKINSLRIGHQNIDTLKIENISNFEPNSEINIGSLIINKELNIHTFRNTSQMRLYKINENIKTEKPKSKLIISNSTFGSAEFQEINFNSFEQVQIYSSNLTNIEMIDINWPDEITPSDDENSLEQLRNTYRMLKHSCMKQEDRIQALKFYSKEMETHRELIRKESLEKVNSNFKKIISKYTYLYLFNKLKNLRINLQTLKLIIIKIFERLNPLNFFERFILLFNDISSKFGLSWIRPIVFILFLNFIFISGIYKYGNVEIQTFQVLNTEINYFWLEFIQMLNPLFNIERIEINKWNELIYTLDVIRKIIFGILLYQLIVAFRKYSRKI